MSLIYKISCLFEGEAFHWGDDPDRSFKKACCLGLGQTDKQHIF